MFKLSDLAEFFKNVKDKAAGGIIFLENKLGENKFRKIMLILFCVFLIIASYEASKEIFTGAVYFKTALIIILAVSFYVLKSPMSLYYILIFVLPFTDFPFTIGFDAFSFVNAIYACFLFVYFFVSVINNKIVIPKTYLNWPIGITIFIFFTSIIQTRFVGEGRYVIKGSFINAPYFRTLFQLSLFIFVVSSLYLTVLILKKEENLKKAIRIWIYSGTFIALLGIYGYFGAKYGLPMASSFVTFDISRIKSTLKEPIFYGIYLATLIPLLFSLILNKSDILPRKFLFTSFTINMAAMFLSMSRASWAAAILTIVLISSINIKFKSLRKKILVITSVIIILAVLIGAIFLIANKVAPETVNKSVLNIFTGKDFSALARIDAMATGWAIFTAHPVLGTGLGNYYYMYLRYSPFSEVIYNWGQEVGLVYISPDANNMYLTVLSETGILGFLAVLSIFVVLIMNIIKSLRQCKNKYWDPFLKGYLGGILFMMIVYLFTSTLMYVFIWVMFGIIISIQRQVEIAAGR